MATFTTRKLARIKEMLMTDLTNHELDDLQAFLSKRPKKNTDRTGFLGLPPEIRNQIYRYVADDAHGRYVHYLPNNLVPVYATNLMKDASGAKARPGLFLACRQLHEEFHQIFYSDLYIDAQAVLPDGEWQSIRSSALLDTIVNKKHNISLSPYMGDKEFSCSNWSDDDIPNKVRGLIRLADGVYVYWWIYVHNAPFSESGQRFDKSNPAHIKDCRIFTARGYHSVPRNEMCSVCLLSG